MIRPATLKDVQQIAEIHVASWQAAYPGLLPQKLLDNLSAEPRANWWRQAIAQNGRIKILVATDEADNIQGFAAYSPSRDDDATEDTAEIQAIYLAPTAWGKGYGRVLMNRALEDIQAQGFTEVTLWVLKGNQRAITFYEKAGFNLENETKTEELGGALITELRYRRPIQTFL